jgi:hypothetical protein
LRQSRLQEHRLGKRLLDAFLPGQYSHRQLVIARPLDAAGS